MVTALYKQLRDKYKTQKDQKVAVHIWKLFARHISLSEQQEQLSAECG